MDNHQVYIYRLYIYEQKTSVCMCCMSANGEIHNAYNLYTIANTVTIVPSGNFTKERNNF